MGSGSGLGSGWGYRERYCRKTNDCLLQLKIDVASEKHGCNLTNGKEKGFFFSQRCRGNQSANTRSGSKVKKWYRENKRKKPRPFFHTSFRVRRKKGEEKKCKMRLGCSKAGDETFACNLDMVPQSKSKDSLYMFFSL